MLNPYSSSVSFTQPLFDTPDSFIPVSVDRGGAHRGHRQVRLRGSLCPRVVLQEGRIPPAVPEGFRGLVGGTAQRHRRPGAAPVYRGAGYVSIQTLFYFVCSFRAQWL